MKKNSGQSVIEMSLLLPMLLMMLGACMVIVYSSWQGIKVQQAANLAARVQGQERVAGGDTNDSIDLENGVRGSGDEDPGKDRNKEFTGNSKAPSDANSVYKRYYDLVKDMFPNGKNQVYVPKPIIGQNVDMVRVIRVISFPSKIPFMPEKWKQVKLEGNAWGGEDTFMYALPRWGQSSRGNSMTSPNTPAWKTMVQEAASSGDNHD